MAIEVLLPLSREPSGSDVYFLHFFRSRLSGCHNPQCSTVRLYDLQSFESYVFPSNVFAYR